MLHLPSALPQEQQEQTLLQEGTRAQIFLQCASLSLVQHPLSHQGHEWGHPCLVFLVTAYRSAVQGQI